MTEYKNLYESLKERCKQLELENTHLKKTIIALEAEKKQWEKEKIVQQLVIQNQLRQSDAKVAQIQNEIIELKKRHGIKE